MAPPVWDARYIRGKTAHTWDYYVVCMGSGGLSLGLMHTAFYSFDVVKHNMTLDPGKYQGLISGLRGVFKEKGLGIWKGWLPAITGNCVHGFFTFGLYEVFKDLFMNKVGEHRSSTHPSAFLIWFSASAMAGCFATIAQCSVEMAKAKVQASSPNGSFAMQIRAALTTMEAPLPLFPSGDLLRRQIPFTLTKLFAFDLLVRFTYQYMFTKHKETYSTLKQLGITFASGCFAGVLCAFVLHAMDKLKPLKAGNAGKEFGDGKFFLTKVLFSPICRTCFFTVGIQWLIYDFFKTAMGMGTTGGIIKCHCEKCKAKGKSSSPVSRQAEFLDVICRKQDTGNVHKIPVITGPRGFRKSTVAREVAAASNDTIVCLSKTTFDKGSKTVGVGIGEAAKGIVESSGDPGAVMVQSIKSVLAYFDSLREEVECVILDDLLTDPATPKEFRTYLTELASLSWPERIVILTSNEGFHWCIEDPTTAEEFIVVHQFPPPTTEELTLALQDALQTRHEKHTTHTFCNVPATLTEKHITEKLVEEVVKTLPERHGYSMRVWGLLLRHPKASRGTVDAVGMVDAVREVLRDHKFLLSVAEVVDLQVAQLSKTNGLLKSNPMPIEDVKKLAGLLGVRINDHVSEVPGRLALLALLQYGNVEDSSTLQKALDPQVQDKVDRIVNSFQKPVLNPLV